MFINFINSLLKF